MQLVTQRAAAPEQSRSDRCDADRGSPCRILALMDYYLPALKVGGPITSVSSMAEQFGPDFRWSILTRDRDLNDPEPYPGIARDEWQPLGNASIAYLRPRSLNLRSLQRWLTTTPHDVLYLNSAFSSRLTIAPLWLRRLGRIPPRPVVLAPRGELGRGALGLKWWKKRPFLKVARALRLYEGIIWHVSSEFERSDVECVFGRTARTIVAPNLTPRGRPVDVPLRSAKRAGRLDAAFLSGIHPVKNLAAAISMLASLRGRIRLSVYGPIRDERYWAQCRTMIRELPETVTVQYHGPVERDRVVATLAGHDVLLFPTLGENFGHVIHESLRAGCPVLISDRTPWRNLEAHGAGWDVPLEEPERFQHILQIVTDMDAADHQRLRQAAQSYVAAVRGGHDPVEENRRVFQDALRAA